jgi:hypothetical protein
MKYFHFYINTLVVMFVILKKEIMNRVDKIRDAATTIEHLATEWEPILKSLDAERITNFRNCQQRNIKQIIGHMIDSAVNNHHRIVRLQYQKRLSFPDYQPDNDTWIAIQNYEDKDWVELVNFWKLYNKHIAYIIGQVEPKDLDNLWTDCFIEPITLENIIIGFPQHMQLHLNEIEELMAQ